MKQALCQSVSFSLMVSTVNYSMSGKASLVLVTLSLTGAKNKENAELFRVGWG